jgi:hypothetical protein
MHRRFLQLALHESGASSDLPITRTDLPRLARNHLERSLWKLRDIRYRNAKRHSVN